MDFIEINVKLTDSSLNKEQLAREIITYVRETAGLRDKVKLDVNSVNNIPLSKTRKLTAVTSEIGK